MPVLPEPVQSRTHKVIHDVIRGCHAAEHMTNALCLFFLPDILIA